MQIAAHVGVKPRLFRWHVAGDILSTDYLRGMSRIADANPHTHFLAFIKAFAIVNRYEDRETVPGNLVIIFSAWPGMMFGCKGGHRGATGTIGPDGPGKSGAVPVDATVRITAQPRQLIARPQGLTVPILCFHYREDAEKVKNVLSKRFAKYGLTLHPEKTRLLEFGRYAGERAKRQG